MLEEFRHPLGISRTALAKHLGLSRRRVGRIVCGDDGITAETGWLLSQALGTTPEFWVNLQAAHDLAAQRPPRQVKRLRKTG